MCGGTYKETPQVKTDEQPTAQQYAQIQKFYNYYVKPSHCVGNPVDGGNSKWDVCYTQAQWDANKQADKPWLSVLANSALTIGSLFAPGAEETMPADMLKVARAYEAAEAATNASKATSFANTLRAIATACATHSFLGDTHVLMADGTTKPIKDIKAGDKVRATDPATGKTTTRTVERLITTHHDKDFATLTVRDGKHTSTITATVTHPFWVPSSHIWITAGNIKPGMTLQGTSGSVITVRAVDLWHQGHVTYDLTVADDHTYYVLAGTDPVLVHNNTGCGLTGRLRLPVGGANAAYRDYQMQVAGMLEVEVTGGGEKIFADGIDGSTLLDAKYASGDSSPYIPGSKAPDFIREQVANDLDDEMRRYAAVIGDPASGFTGLQDITNDSRAVPYLQSFMDKYGVPGSISVVK